MPKILNHSPTHVHPSVTSSCSHSSCTNLCCAFGGKLYSCTKAALGIAVTAKDAKVVLDQQRQKADVSLDGDRCHSDPSTHLAGEEGKDAVEKGGLLVGMVRIVASHDTSTATRLFHTYVWVNVRAFEAWDTSVLRLSGFSASSHNTFVSLITPRPETHPSVTTTEVDPLD